LHSLRLQTERMLLVAGNLELALAESSDRKELSELLDAEIPSNWPPPLNDDDSLQWVINFFTANPGAVGWSLWYFLLDRPGERRLAIGNGGLKGLPSAIISLANQRGCKTPPMFWRGSWLLVVVLLLLSPYFLGLLIGTRSCSVVRGCCCAYLPVTKRPVTALRSTGLVGMVFAIGCPPF